MSRQRLGGLKMDKLIDWIVNTLSISGINSKSLVKSTLEEMSIDDWYALREECNNKITELKSKGFKPESNPNILLLKSYQSDSYQCKVLQREIDNLSNFVKGPNYSGMPFVASSENTVESQHINLIEAKHNLEMLLSSKGHKLQRCIDIINKVTDPRGIYILTGIFLDNKNLYEIMIEAPFEMSYRQILRVKKAALDEIRKMEVG